MSREMNKEELLKKFNKPENMLILKIKEALYDERLDHKSCDYEFGCIIESDTLEKKWKKLLDQTIKEVKKEAIGELSGIIEDGITRELSIESIYARLQCYILKVLRKE